MKRLFSVSLGICIAILMVIGSERRAWGYVDPGSGLIAIQTVASVIAAYLYVIRKRVVGFFSRKKQDAPATPDAAKTGRAREIA